MELGGYPRWARIWLAELEESGYEKGRPPYADAAFDAGIAMFGLAFLDWSPYPLVLFMLFSLWLGIFAWWFEWLANPNRVHAAQTQKLDVIEAVSLVPHFRDGEPLSPPEDATDDGGMSRIGVQIIVTVYFIGAYTLFMLYQLVVNVGVPLWDMLVASPDMLVVMGVITALRIYGVTKRARSELQPASWLFDFPPWADIFIFPAIFVYWNIFGGVAKHAVDIWGGDHQFLSGVILITAGYALAVIRAVVEYKINREVIADLRWLARQKTDEG